MYGEQFKLDYKQAISIEENIVKGEKFRFTVLSKRLIRLEYNEQGIFLDKPTELVWFRNMPKVPFKKEENARYIAITTSYFRLTYLKNSSFEASKLTPTAHLKVELLNTNRVWYYGNPQATEARNFGSPGMSLEKDNKSLKNKRGLYSPSGYSYLDDSDGLVFLEDGSLVKRAEKSIDIYLFMYLNDFDECLKDYFMITGSPALIPRYALGNWWSRNLCYNDETLRDLVVQFKESEIPMSVLLLDKDWHVRHLNGKVYDTGFTWNSDYFKNPNALVSYLHSCGIRVGLNINPFEGIYPFELNYQNISHYLQPNQNGIIPFNVYDKKLLEVYFKLLIHPLDYVGVDFFWIDLNDKNNLKELWALNHYHFYDMKRDYRRRSMILTRNPMIASHRYPVLYSGKTNVSWDTLYEIPFHNESATNIGVSFWSHDIGGYYNGIEDDELYIRFVELGVFSPILKFGSDRGKYY